MLPTKIPDLNNGPDVELEYGVETQLLEVINSVLLADPILSEDLIREAKHLDSSLAVIRDLDLALYSPVQVDRLGSIFGVSVGILNSQIIGNHILNQLRLEYCAERDGLIIWITLMVSELQEWSFRGVKCERKHLERICQGQFNPGMGQPENFGMTVIESELVSDMHKILLLVNGLRRVCVDSSMMETWGRSLDYTNPSLDGEELACAQCEVLQRSYMDMKCGLMYRLWPKCWGKISPLGARVIAPEMDDWDPEEQMKRRSARG